MMKVALIIVAAVSGLILLIVIVGSQLPVKHSAWREATYPLPPETVYHAISDIASFPQWRSKVKTAEILSGGENTRFRENGSDGAIVYVIEEARPPQHLVTRIDDKSLPFGGKWTYELTPSGSGTTLRITEDGEVYNPLFRFMSRFVFGHHATIDTYLEDLRKHLISAG